jgi:hypothetical protein
MSWKINHLQIFSVYDCIPSDHSVLMTNKHNSEADITKVDDHLQKFEEGLASIQVSRPNTYHNICDQECDLSRSTIYPCNV